MTLINNTHIYGNTYDILFMNERAALKHHIQDRLHGLAFNGDATASYHTDARWWGCHPINECQGIEQINKIWETLHQSFPDMERRDLIFVLGENYGDSRSHLGIEGLIYAASICHYQGTFSKPLFGIPPTSGVIHLRSSEVHQIVDGRIKHSFVLMDFLDLMRQSNVWPLGPSLGAEGMWPGPATQDGLRPLCRDLHVKAKRPIEIILSMHAALSEFNGKTVNSMPLENFWTKNFQYYAASGIGTTRGLQGFRLHHQIPFLTGFPDRKGAGHYIRIDEGNFAVTGGWPSVKASHMGEWLGIPATGKQINMRVMDFYRLRGNHITENWVPIDIIHTLLEMGVDLFGRMRHMCGNPLSDIPQITMHM